MIRYRLRLPISIPTAYKTVSWIRCNPNLLRRINNTVCIFPLDDLFPCDSKTLFKIG